MIDECKGIILTEALFKKDGVPDYGSLELPQLEEDLEDFEPWPFRFHIDSIESYNPAEEGLTTLRLASGDKFRINVPFDIFDTFIIETLKSYDE